MKNKSILFLSVGLIAAFVMVLLIPINISAYGDTRVIVEYTDEAYIAPPCFDQANASNNIGEMTLKEAKEMGYLPESACTEQALQGKSKMIIVVLAEKLSIKESEWDW